MDPQALQRRQWEPHQGAISRRNFVAMHTWRSSFGSAYRVSIGGLSASEAAERLHALAHKWINVKIAKLTGSTSSQVNVPPFGKATERVNLSIDGISVKSSSFIADGGAAAGALPERAWHAALEHRDIEQDGRLWRLSLGVKTIEGAEVLLSVESAIKDAVALPSPALTVPFIGFLRQELGDALQVSSGRTLLPGRPILVDTDAKIRDLFLDLKDETRSHPIVLVSGYRNPDGTFSYLVDPAKLARSVGGVAKVYVEGSVQFCDSSELKHALLFQLGLEEDYLVWGGAVRVYQPGDIENCSPMAHRYFYQRPNQTEEQVRDLIRERCHQLGSNDVRAHPLDPIVRKEDVDLLSTREQVMRLEAQPSGQTNTVALTNQIVEWREIAEAYSVEVEKLKQQMQEQAAALESAKGKIDQLVGERAEVMAVNVELQAEMARLKKELARRPTSSDVTAVDPEQLASGKEVLDAVRAVFSDRIVFSDRGEITLREFEPKKEEIYAHVYNAIHDLYTIVWPRKFGEFESNFILEFQNSSRYGLAMVESALTKEKPGIEESRQDSFKGKKITAWAHVKYGKKPGEQFRLHFDFVGEGKDGRIVVSWVGDHMPTAASAKNGKRRG